MNRGTAYHVIRAQFKRAVGIIASRTVAQIKLKRISYIRFAKVEAANAAEPYD